VKVLVTYRSKYGAAAECAHRISRGLPLDTEVVDLARVRDPVLSGADAVVIGGSIYGGKIQREVTAFCERHREALLGTRVALFICCLFRDEAARALLAASFPDWLNAHAFGREWLGGVLSWDKLTAVDRMLVRGVPGAGENVSLLRSDVIDRLTRDIGAAVKGSGEGA
jgi:menaquinone-dependent protoporphyrinogen oxidase